MFNYWFCFYCVYENNYKEKKCVVCGEEKKYSGENGKLYIYMVKVK